MSNSEQMSQVRGFLTPPPKWRSNRCFPVMPRSERKPWSSVNGPQAKADIFHVIHKVPAGDSPYVKAKQVQVIDKDPGRAVSLFWAAINAGDRVDSALKDMAVVMKQLNRSDEAIEAIKSFRHLCPLESQESLDNVLIELYKRSGRIEEEIQMLQLKIKNIEEGIAFDGKRMKMGRSQGKKIHITIEKEYSRLLGNLAWAHLQLEDYKSAEEHYRKALSLEPDKNQQCNLAICLVHLNKIAEAKFLLQSVRASCVNDQMDESYARSFERATQILDEIELQTNKKPMKQGECISGEVQTLSPSCVKRNLRGYSSGANGGQSDLPGSIISPGSANVCHDQRVSLNERKGGACFKNHDESNTNFSGSSRGNMKGAYSCSRKNENRIIYGEVGCDTSWIHAYASTVSLSETPRVPFTQPQKCLINGDQRRGQLVEEAVGGCNRKLSFEPHKDCENVQLVTLHNCYENVPVPANKEFESARTRIITSENCRKSIAEGHAKVSIGPPVNSLSDGNWRKNILENDEQHKVPKEECNLLTDLSVDGVRTRVKQFSFADCDKSFTTMTAYNLESTEAAESDTKYQKSNGQLNTDLKQFHDFSTRKKSWADMVEEDEQQLQSGRDDFADDRWQSPSHKTRFPCRSPSKCSDKSKGREDFPDENYNANVVLQTPVPLNEPQNLNEKNESLGLRDCYYTQPQAAAKPLSFDDHQKSDVSANCFSSPLQKRALDFECHNTLSFKEDLVNSNGPKLLRRSRLQVFQDITPESPKC